MTRPLRNCTFRISREKQLRQHGSQLYQSRNFPSGLQGSLWCPVVGLSGTDLILPIPIHNYHPQSRMAITIMFFCISALFEKVLRKIKKIILEYQKEKTEATVSPLFMVSNCFFILKVHKARNIGQCRANVNQNKAELYICV